MGDLLQRVPLAAPTSKKAPLLIEVPVNGKGAPFLISGIRDWVWVEGSRTGILRSAVRSGSTPADIFIQVVGEVMRKGVAHNWGNKQDFSNEGLQHAVEYVTSFGIKAVEVLAPVGFTLQTPNGVTFSESPWVPSGKAVIVPVDRTYLGMLGTLGVEFYTVVLHNPSRGMAVLGDW